MPLVTAIKSQLRRPNRVSVFLDGRFAFGLNAKVAERFELKCGMELSPEFVESLLSGQVQQECVDKAFSYVSRRMHSRKELTQKLAKAEFAPQVIEIVLQKLEKLGYVNDEEYARQKLLHGQRKLIGKRLAMAELMRGGVNKEVAQEAVGRHFATEDASANAQKLIEKNLPRLQRLDPQTAKRRLIGLLQRRGFDFETILPLVQRALGAPGEES